LESDEQAHMTSLSTINDSLKTNLCFSRTLNLIEAFCRIMYCNLLQCLKPSIGWYDYVPCLSIIFRIDCVPSIHTDKYMVLHRGPWVIVAFLHVMDWSIRRMLYASNTRIVVVISWLL